MLEEEVQRLLEEAERIDAEEDAKYGKGKRVDEIPKDLRRREDRLKKIREAKARLEAQAKQQAEAQAVEAKAKVEERAQKEAERGQKFGGKPTHVPDPEQTTPDPKAQSNFTDPESRIMVDGANKGSFVQAYNVQIAVDANAQIIVARNVTQQATDKQQLVPMAEEIRAGLGRLADVTTADAGYFSEQAIEHSALVDTQLLVPPNREKKSVSTTEITGATSPKNSVATRMREILNTDAGSALYRRRKAIVEPVFGQIKDARNFRRFSLRGFENVTAEFDLIALTHNLLKLFRYGSIAPAMS